MWTVWQRRAEELDLDANMHLVCLAAKHPECRDVLYCVLRYCDTPIWDQKSGLRGVSEVEG